MLRSPRNHLPRLNREYVQLAGRMNFSSNFYHQIGLQEGSKELGDDLRRAVATSLQEACAEILGSILEYFCKREGTRNICLGGGLFQNALLVGALEKRFGMNHVFVPPAPGNSGCALGAALLAWNSVQGKPRLAAVRCIYGGPPCDRSEVKDVLDNSKARYSLQITEERKLDATLQLLQAGKIVGWFQGAAEFGPRALCNRSLLASPWAPYIKENLNDYVKHREWFCPFAVSVPEEDCGRYFEYSQQCESMNSVA